MQGGYDFFAANSGTYVSFSAAPGSRLSLGLKYDGLGAATALSHRITLSYTIGGDTLSEEFTMVLRREDRAGADSDLVGLNFAALKSGGQAVSIGEVILSRPLSSVGGVADARALPAVVLPPES